MSLFSGCGGLDLGFLGGFEFCGKHYESFPFDIVWANDLDERACDTYAANLGDEHLFRGDINDVLDMLPSSADVVIGGFPCQDVSINGQRNAERGCRTILYQKMIDVIKRCKPKVFVAENVKGLLMSHSKPFFERMIKDFETTGYVVSHRVYLAADYKVPQMRERLFIVGTQESDRAFLHPPAAIGDRMSARKAIGDLEDVKEDPTISHVWSRAKRSPDQGGRKLTADQPATTIRAEHHGNVQFHYKANRRISLREAARQQSFPDSFRFTSAMRPTERQIGNAVPPVLGWHIGNAVFKHVEKSTN